MTSFTTNIRAFCALIVASLLLTAVSAPAQERTVQAATVVTVMPKNGHQPPMLTIKDVQVSANYKSAAVTSMLPLMGQRGGLELIVLIDDAARTSLALQLPDLKKFVANLPPQTQVGVAYMQNGRANILQSPTGDHAAAARAFRITRGLGGANASPYFCLSDLAKHWPAVDPDNRREVLMITDGADPYTGAGFDPNDPYVLASIADAQRARVIVDSVYYRDAGDGGMQFSGQDYLLMVAKGTGGKSYYQMSGNPVSFQPYLDDLHARLMNQYELGFLARPKGRADLQAFKVKVLVPQTSLDAPEKVPIIPREGR